MRELLLRILRRSVFVALMLGVMGYVFAEMFLALNRFNGVIPDPANETVKWRTPLTMAGFGVAMLAGLEFLIYFIRRGRTGEPLAMRNVKDQSLDRNRDTGSSPLDD